MHGGGVLASCLRRWRGGPRQALPVPACCRFCLPLGSQISQSGASMPPSIRSPSEIPALPHNMLCQMGCMQPLDIRSEVVSDLSAFFGLVLGYGITY